MEISYKIYPVAPLLQMQYLMSPLSFALFLKLSNLKSRIEAISCRSAALNAATTVVVDTFPAINRINVTDVTYATFRTLATRLLPL